VKDIRRTRFEVKINYPHAKQKRSEKQEKRSFWCVIETKNGGESDEVECRSAQKKDENERVNEFDVRPRPEVDCSNKSRTRSTESAQAKQSMGISTRRARWRMTKGE
jgi:hypothetical protein